MSAERVAGGYFLVGGIERPPGPTWQSLPPWIWTPTSCLCELYPDTWGFAWCNAARERTESALRELGLEPSDLARVQAWIDREFASGGVGFPGMFCRFPAAVEFAERFVRPGPRIKLLGIGLPEPYVDELLEQARPAPDQGTDGVYQAVQSGLPLLDGGQSLGFEPLGYEPGGFHSFLCNSLQNEYRDALGIGLNAHGRLASLADAERAVAHTRLDSTGAEPALWQPWEIVEYPLPRGRVVGVAQGL